MKKLSVTVVTSRHTGNEYYVVKSLRGRYFYIVPRKNPAQKALLADRRDYSKPIEVEVA
jgi:hypothetical protein